MGIKVLMVMTVFSSSLTMNAFAQADQASDSAGLKSIQDITRAMPTPQDRELNDQVRGALQGDTSLQPVLSDVQLKTVNGVVYLKGTVPSENEQRQLEDKVRALPGVMQVQSFIRIAGH